MNGFDGEVAELWIKIAREADNDEALERLLARLYEASKPPGNGRHTRHWAQETVKEVSDVLLEIGAPARVWLKARRARGDVHAEMLEAAMAGV